MPKFETETGAIFYELLGDPRNGQTITLLHNFMSTGRAAWGPFLDELTAHYRVILPDLPGHGQSLGHPASFDHRIFANQMAALLGAEEASHGHLAGCSAGGMVAQLMVDRGLVHPATLTLVSTTHSTVPSTTGDGERLLPEQFQASRNWMEATARLHDPYRYDGYYEEVLLPGFRRLTGETSIDLPLAHLAQWETPVCLIHGAKDEFFPPSIPQRMAETLPHGELHLIPRQSHALIFRQPWKVRSILLDFLARHPIPATEQLLSHDRED